MDIVTTGPALRLPKKNAIDQWKPLYKIYFIQKKAAALKGNSLDYLRGFSNNFNSNLYYDKVNMPMKQKEKATIEDLINYNY